MQENGKKKKLKKKRTETSKTKNIKKNHNNKDTVNFERKYFLDSTQKKRKTKIDKPNHNQAQASFKHSIKR